MWRPLATVTFPSGHQGLTAFRELREFRKRHEHEWTYHELGSWNKKEALQKVMDQKANSVADLAVVLERQAKLAEKHQLEAAAEQEQIQKVVQKANARMDEITVQKQELKSAVMSGDEKAKQKYKAIRNEKILLRKAIAEPMPHFALAGKYHALNDKVPLSQRGRTRTRKARVVPRMSMHGLRIGWANLLDAEYAPTWPASVLHEELPKSDNRTRHSHVIPDSEVPGQTELEETKVATDEEKIETQTQPAVEVAKDPAPDEPNWMARLSKRISQGRN